jgi:hypothetical protein
VLDIHTEHGAELELARTRAEGSLEELKTKPNMVIDAPPVAATFVVPLIEVRVGTLKDVRYDKLPV